MDRKRNSKGQFISDNILIKIPGPLKIIKILIYVLFIFFTLFPWLFVLLRKVKVIEFFITLMEYLFTDGIKSDSTDKKGEKKGNGFF